MTRVGIVTGALQWVLLLGCLLASPAVTGYPVEPPGQQSPASHPAVPVTQLDSQIVNPNFDQMILPASDLSTNFDSNSRGFNGKNSIMSMLPSNHSLMSMLSSNMSSMLMLPRNLSSMVMLPANLSSIFLSNIEVNATGSPTALRDVMIRSSTVYSFAAYTTAVDCKNFLVSHSTLVDIREIVAMSDMEIRHSKIIYVGSDGLKIHSSLKVLNSTIVYVSTDGIQSVMGSGVVMVNTSIDVLDRHAVSVLGGGDLTLTNVSITHCQTPCFVLTSAMNLHIQGVVTINGAEVDESKFHEYAVYKYGNHLNQSEVKQLGTKGCKAKLSTLDCTFDNHRGPAVAGPFPSSFSKVNVKDSTNTVLLHNCGLNLFITNTTGSIELASTNPCKKDSEFFFQDSSLTEVVLPKSTSAYVFVSTIDIMYGSSFPTAVIKRISFAYIGVLQNVAVTKRHSFSWADSVIDIVKNVSLYNDHTVMNSLISNQISDLDVHTSLHFKDCLINSISSIKLHANSQLLFTNTEITFAQRRSIYLEKNATLTFVRSAVSFPVVHGIISADSYDQITGYSYFSAGFWLPDLVHQRRKASSVLAPELAAQFAPLMGRKARASGSADSTNIEASAAVNTTVMDEKFCDTTEDNDTVCDYRQVDSGSVVHTVPGDGSDGESASSGSRVFYMNTGSLRLCSQGYPREVVLQDVNDVDLSQLSHQLTRLTVSKSSFESFDSRAYELVLEDSIVGYVEADRMDVLQSSRSMVAFLDIAVGTVDLNDTKINEITKLRVLERAVISNCNVRTIPRLAVHVPFGSTLLIENSTIGSIETEGMIIEGEIIMRNVVINSTSTASVILAKGAGNKSMFKNVTIHTEGNNSFLEIIENENVNKRDISDSETNSTSLSQEPLTDDSLGNDTSSDFVSISLDERNFPDFLNAFPSVLDTIRSTIVEFYNATNTLWMAMNNTYPITDVDETKINKDVMVTVVLMDNMIHPNRLTLQQLKDLNIAPSLEFGLVIGKQPITSTENLKLWSSLISKPISSETSKNILHGRFNESDSEKNLILDLFNHERMFLSYLNESAQRKIMAKEAVQRDLLAANMTVPAVAEHPVKLGMSRIVFLACGLVAASILGIVIVACVAIRRSKKHKSGDLKPETGIMTNGQFTQRNGSDASAFAKPPQGPGTFGTPYNTPADTPADSPPPTPQSSPENSETDTYDSTYGSGESTGSSEVMDQNTKQKSGSDGAISMTSTRTQASKEQREVVDKYRPVVKEIEQLKLVGRKISQSKKDLADEEMYEMSCSPASSASNTSGSPKLAEKSRMDLSDQDELPSEESVETSPASITGKKTLPKKPVRSSSTCISVSPASLTVNKQVQTDPIKNGVTCKDSGLTFTQKFGPPHSTSTGNGTSPRGALKANESPHETVTVAEDEQKRASLVQTAEETRAYPNSPEMSSVKSLDETIVDPPSPDTHQETETVFVAYI